MDDGLKKALESITDVKYVIGMAKCRTYVNSEKQLIAIAELYSAYKDKSFSDEKGDHPYISMHVDEQNNTYLTIEIDRIQKAHLMTQGRKRKEKLMDMENVPDVAYANPVDDMTLEDMIMLGKHIDGSLELYSDNGEIEMIVQFDREESRFSKFMNRGYWTDIFMFEKYDMQRIRLSRFYMN